jgi:hypothetical protein
MAGRNSFTVIDLEQFKDLYVNKEERKRKRKRSK